MSRALRLLVPALTSLALAGGAAAAVPSSPTTPAATARAAAPVRVLAISVDGLNPAAIKRLGPSGAPTFFRLRAEGATTLNARTEVEQTVTLPNHTSMMTGRRIDRRHRGHGVTWDDDRPGTTVQGAAGHPVASIFTLASSGGTASALFTTKPKFGLYERSWPRAIGTFVADEKQGRLVKAARSDLKKNPRPFTFLHVSLPDKAGHAHGFMSPSYVRAVHQTDVLLGKVMRAIDNSPALRSELVVILTADHGGKGAGHSAPRKLGNYRIPFMVWGPGVAHGNLYAMNRLYRDPGTLQLGYTGRQPIRNGDVADLAAHLLGRGPVPGSTIGDDQTLQVSTPATP